MTSPSASTLRSRLVDQAASDLAENRRRQQELAEKTRMLKQEESLLVDILQLAERYEGLTEHSPLPEQAQAEPTLTPTTPRRTPAPHTPRTGKKTRTTTPKATRQPLLG
ncbi:hypothetical protein AB0C52_28070, partial [Streptomyces sp. NPDC048717]